LFIIVGSFLVGLGSAEFSITLNSPIDNYNTSDTTPDFNFTVSGNESSYSCELFLNDTRYGISWWCYQESANESTVCGGLGTGSYSFSLSSGTVNNNGSWRDGNWSSYTKCSDSDKEDGLCYMYVNYTKPSEAVGISKWQTKYKGGGSGTISYINYTIPSECWELNPVRFKMTAFDNYYEIGINTDYVKGECYNGSAWIQMFQNKGETSGDEVYEEAMWWNLEGNNLGVGNNTATIITTNTSLSDGTYNWYINCTAGGVTNQSETMTITIDTTPPLVTINKPQLKNYTSLQIPLNVSVSDSHLDECWYSLDNWATNTTFTPNSETTITADDELNTLKVACNDTSGNINNSESVQFYVFTEPYYVSPTPPDNWNSSGNNTFTVAVELNWSAETCYFEWNYSSNTTMNKINSSFFNYTKTVTVDGTYNYSVWCNSSLNGFWRQSSYRTVIMWNVSGDTTPPDIYNIQPSGNPTYSSSTTSVTFSFNTNEQAICRYSNLDVNFSSMVEMANTNGTVHSQTVSVTAGNCYTYYIRCNDTSGNINDESESVGWCIESKGGGGGGGTTSQCGNFICEPGENAENCPSDCGEVDMAIEPQYYRIFALNKERRTETLTIINREAYPLTVKLWAECIGNDTSCKWVKFEDETVEVPAGSEGLPFSVDVLFYVDIPPDAHGVRKFNIIAQAKTQKVSATYEIYIGFEFIDYLLSTPLFIMFVIILFSSFIIIIYKKVLA